MKLDIPKTTNNMKIQDELPRAHMGVSLAGEECDRKLWLIFRWVIIEKFDERIKMIFRLGKEAEKWMVDDLRSAGVSLNNVLDDQEILDFGKHVKGSPDGVGIGFLEAPKKAHLVEFKTINDKGFKALVSKGVKESRYMHYAQTQCYMYHKELDRTFYLAMNKNDSSYYQERWELDKELAEKLIKRLQRIALQDRLPVPLSTDKEFWRCRFCPMQEFCFEGGTPEVNCRTCAHSTAREDDTWFCERWENIIPVNGQREGCRSHVIHPDLVDAKIEECDDWNVYYDGILVGEKGVSSKDYLEMSAEAIANMFKGFVVRK